MAEEMEMKGKRKVNMFIVLPTSPHVESSYCRLYLRLDKRETYKEEYYKMSLSQSSAGSIMVQESNVAEKEKWSLNLAIVRKEEPWQGH